MKRFTIIVALTLLFAFSGLAEHVRPDVAQKAAKTFLSAKLIEQPSISLVDFADRASLPNLYVYGNDHCFVIMATDDRVQPVLGYSVTSAFGNESLPDNVREWLQGYNDEIQSAIDNQMRASTEATTMWEELIAGNTEAARSTLAVAPLIQTKWNQNAYYNELCPEAEGGPNGRAYTGCTATSMAQIMKYYNYPSRGIGSHSYDWNGQTLSADFGATTYDWDNMSPYYDYYYDNDGGFHWLSDPSSTEITAVATLMYHCGVSVNMNYSGSGSGASLYNAAMAFRTYFNYCSEVEYRTKSSYGDDEWKTMVKNELDADRPLHYAGYNPSGSGGHAFVCDGYDNSDYFHFNWGWAGHYDGYFLLSNLDTGANSSEPGAGNGVYTRDQEAVFGIRPSTNNAIPTNLTYTQNDRNITLSWTGASGASSYNIYCNDNYIGNSTTNSYTTTAPFGTSVYYVRSVNSNGELSLCSNNITVTVSYSTPVVDDLQASVAGNNVNLSWTAPEWCYPQTPTATVSYGDGDTYYSWTYTYYAHRYLAADLAQYANKAVYKVSTYVQYPGTYSAYVYVGSTSSGQPNSSGLAMSKLDIEVHSVGWYDFEADSPIVLSGTEDLWVVMKQENTGQNYPTPSFNLTQHNTNAFYAGSSPTYLYDANSNYNCAWRINASVTDGVYTYNIYRNGSSIANNVNNTSYNDNNLANGTYSYYVKTNYYGGQTVASNTVNVEVGNVVNYTITAIANPTEGGIVSGDGTYAEGDECTLTATPSTGYTFIDWTENGNQVSTDATYSFAVTGDRTLMANFSTITLLTSLSDDFNDGEINPVYWTATGPNVYEEDGLLKLQQNVTDSYVALESAHMGVPANNQIVIDRSFLVHDELHNSYWGSHYFYGDVNIIIDGNDDNYNIGICYYDDDYEDRHGTYLRVQLNEEVNETRICDAYFDTWLTEKIILDITNETLSYYLSDEFVSILSIPGLSTLQMDYYTIRFKPYGWWTGHYHNMDYVNINMDGTYYNVSASANPNDGGIITGCGSYLEGTTCALTATPNEGYSFVNWTKDGQQVSTDATYSFIVTQVGVYVANFSQNQEDETQTTYLTEGWNWWSSYVELDGIDGLGQMETSLGDNGIMIKSRNDGFVTNYSPFWVGTLESVNNESTYLIQTNAVCEMTITGNAVTPSAHPITLPVGWSWIGYPCTTPMSVSEALSGLTPMENDLLKSRESFAVYTPGIGWLGTLQTIEPGMGLMFESHNTSPVTLTYPNPSKSGALLENITAKDNHWEPEMQGYAQNMNVMATVELEGSEVEGERYELAAFSAGECRGSAKLMYVEPIHKYMAFLTVYGEGGEELGFGLYDALSGAETYDSGESLVFEANAVVGAVDVPLVVRFGGMTGMDEFGRHIHLFPNPVGRGENVSIGVTADEIGEAQIEIINAFGQVVETCQGTSLKTTIVAPNVAGVYILRITIDGKGTCYRRMIVR